MNFLSIIDLAVAFLIGLGITFLVTFFFAAYKLKNLSSNGTINETSSVIAEITKSLPKKVAIELEAINSDTYLGVAESMIDSWIIFPKFLLNTFVYFGLGFALLGLSITVANIDTLKGGSNAAEMQNWVSGIAAVLGGFKVAFYPALGGVILTIIGALFIALYEHREADYLNSLQHYLVTSLIPKRIKSSSPLDQLNDNFSKVITSFVQIADSLQLVPDEINSYLPELKEITVSLDKTIRSWDNSVGTKVLALGQTLDSLVQSIEKTVSAFPESVEFLNKTVVQLDDSVSQLSATCKPLMQIAESQAQLTDLIQSEQRDLQKLTQDFQERFTTLSEEMVSISTSLADSQQLNHQIQDENRSLVTDFNDRLNEVTSQGLIVYSDGLVSTQSEFSNNLKLTQTRFDDSLNLIAKKFDEGIKDYRELLDKHNRDVLANFKEMQNDQRNMILDIAHLETRNSELVNQD